MGISFHESDEQVMEIISKLLSWAIVFVLVCESFAYYEYYVLEYQRSIESV